MRKRSTQKGEGRAGCIFWVAILAAFIFIAWQVVPAKVNISDLEDFITRQAESAGRASAQKINASILARAKDLGLPVREENLSVEKRGGRIIISCDYEIPVSLLVYTYQWKIRHRIDRPVFVV